MIAAAITRVNTIGEDCSVTVRPRTGQRSSLERETSVATRAPVTRINEFTMPSLNSDHAGAVLSIGRITSMPVREANQVSKAVTLSAKTVGFSVASSAGRMQAGFVAPVSLLHSGR